MQILECLQSNYSLLINRICTKPKMFQIIKVNCFIC